jgi:hypothetical protein
MSLRTIQAEEAINKFREEQNYTGAYLENDEDGATRARAAEVDPWLERIDSVEAGQQLCWRNETRARAALNGCNHRVGRLIKRFSLVLLAVFEDRKSPGYIRYFPNDPPSKVMRRALAAQVSEIKRWPAFLAAETNEQLKAFAPLFQDLLDRATAALDAQNKAQESTKQHRYTQIITLVDELNAWRQGLYGWLTQRAAENGFDTDWARSFFL